MKQGLHCITACKFSNSNSFNQNVLIKYVEKGILILHTGLNRNILFIEGVNFVFLLHEATGSHGNGYFRVAFSIYSLEVMLQ